MRLFFLFCAIVLARPSLADSDFLQFSFTSVGVFYALEFKDADITLRTTGEKIVLTNSDCTKSAFTQWRKQIAEAVNSLNQAPVERSRGIVVKENQEYPVDFADKRLKVLRAVPDRVRAFKHLEGYRCSKSS